MALTERQRTILNAVTERYIGTGAPVSSKELVGVAGLFVSSSTVRNEFALLEEKGYLTHPHTSAGRVPTDLGYREFVDHLMSGPQPRSPARPGLAPGASGVAAARGPGRRDRHRPAAGHRRHVPGHQPARPRPRAPGERRPARATSELLTLHPTQLMYVFIVSTGGVMKGVIDWPRPVDPGLVEWARTYLNETLNEQTLTARLIRRALDNPELSPREAAFLKALAPAFERLVDEQYQEELFVGGASRLLAEPQLQDVSSLRDLLALLEERFLLLRVLRAALGTRHGGGPHRQRARSHRAAAVLRRGRQLRAASAAAGHGQPGGPDPHGLREAIATVRETAQLLSELVGERYE